MGKNRTIYVACDCCEGFAEADSDFDMDLDTAFCDDCEDAGCDGEDVCQVDDDDDEDEDDDEDDEDLLGDEEE